MQCRFACTLDREAKFKAKEIAAATPA